MGLRPYADDLTHVLKPDKKSKDHHNKTYDTIHDCYLAAVTSHAMSQEKPSQILKTLYSAQNESLWDRLAATGSNRAGVWRSKHLHNASIHLATWIWSQKSHTHLTRQLWEDCSGCQVSDRIDGKGTLQIYIDGGSVKLGDEAHLQSCFTARDQSRRFRYIRSMVESFRESNTRVKATTQTRRARRTPSTRPTDSHGQIHRVRRPPLCRLQQASREMADRLASLEARLHAVVYSGWGPEPPRPTTRRGPSEANVFTSPRHNPWLQLFPPADEPSRVEFMLV